MSTVFVAASPKRRAISKRNCLTILFPALEQELSPQQKGFNTSVALYCVYVIVGTHVEWTACFQDQYQEYQCYKEHPSIVLLAVVGADRKFLHIGIGRLGVPDGSTISESLSLRQIKIDGVC